MKKLSLVFLLLFSVFSSRAQFNPDFARQDIRASYGFYTAPGHGPESQYLQITYTRLFREHFSWKAGALYQPNPTAYEALLGIPLSISYRSATATFDERISAALNSPSPTNDWYFTDGHEEMVWGDLLLKALSVFIRRTEFFAGVTPGYYLGPANTSSDVKAFRRFSFWADAGMVASIPIWRFALNVTPAFHYSFLNNYESKGSSIHFYFSLSAGISYQF